MNRPLAIDLYCGLGGWTEGLLAEGYDVIGFDIEAHRYGDHRYPGQLVVQDVLTLHGSQFKHADLIVGSSPCQEFSYRAMPWSRAKALPPPELGMRLFEAQFRIQREACEAAGRHIPMIVENVRGAQKWVGRARWNFGSFYLWGDVPALMPPAVKAQKFSPDGSNHGQGSWFAIADSKNRGSKVPGFRFDGSGKSFQSASVEGVKQRGSGAAWLDKALDERRKNPDGVKSGGDWFNSAQPSEQRRHGSKSTKRKHASAMIAKIPLPLSRHIAATYRP